MKSMSLFVLFLLCIKGYSQQLIQGTYKLGNQSLIIHNNQRFEIYDYRWSDDFEIPYGSGGYNYTNDSLILIFDDIDTSEITQTMTQYLNITTYKLEERNDNKELNSLLVIKDMLTGFPIPGIEIKTSTNTLITNQYGEININSDSAITELNIFHPYWAGP